MSKVPFPAGQLCQKIALERDTDTFLLVGRDMNYGQTSHKRGRSGSCFPDSGAVGRGDFHTTRPSHQPTTTATSVWHLPRGKNPGKERTRFARRRNSEAAHATSRKGASLAVAGHGQQGEMAVSAVFRYSSSRPQNIKLCFLSSISMSGFSRFIVLVHQQPTSLPGQNCCFPRPTARPPTI